MRVRLRGHPLRMYAALTAFGAISAIAGGIAVAATQAAVTRTGTVVNTCTNPVVDRDLTGWGRHGTGSDPTRIAISNHVVADYAYSQPSSNGADPEMYLPQKDVTPGERWTFAMDTWIYGPAATATVNMQVDWYTSASVYLGHTEGPALPVTASTTEVWTRVAGDFTAPATAARANVTAQLTAPAGMTWNSTACDYRPAGAGPGPTTGGPTNSPTGSPTTSPTLQPTTPPPTPPPTSPPSDDTAAARFGWGTALPASDEFNYGSSSAPAQPDQSKWNLAGANPCWAGHDGNGQRCDKNTRVLGGILRMTGESSGDSGWLGSKFSQRYGRWEVRARSQATTANNGRQYHPVLIVWPSNNDWPAGAEYDYLENSAPGESCAEAFLHYPNHQPRRQESAQKCSVDLTQFHNFGFEWTPQHLVGYIDGVQWFSFSADCIQCAPYVMNQTIQLDNFYGNNMQAAVLDVDWARVYSIPGVSTS